MPETNFMKTDMHIMPPDPISTAKFINATHQDTSITASNFSDKTLILLERLHQFS
jgi:hypothetical protein